MLIVRTTMWNCNSGNINSYCYICGRYTIPAKRINITKAVKDNYAFYFSKVILLRPWSPNICCLRCYSSLENWVAGKINQLPFGVPMEWSDPGRNHGPYNCYVCANDARGQNRHRLKRFRYQSVAPAILPKPHSIDVPVPNRPSPQVQHTGNVDTPDLPDAPSLAGPTTNSPSVFLPEPQMQPLSERQLHSIARNLHLSKTKSEALGIELKKYNLLQPSVTVTSFRTRNDVFKPFFSVNEQKDLVYCKDVTGLMAAMNIRDYNAEEWRLFIDSSQSSLKGLFFLLVKIVKNNRA